MNSKQCEKCGETAELAMAFCQGCGDPFVQEETRRKLSEFEASAGTVQFGQSLYNELLSDMGLNISEAPNKQLNDPPHIPPVEPVNVQPKRAKGLSSNQIIAIGTAFIFLLTIGAAFIAIAAIFIYMRWEQLTF